MRLVREIASDLPGIGPQLRFQKTALAALQEASEANLVSIFEGKHWLIVTLIITIR